MKSGPVFRFATFAFAHYCAFVKGSMFIISLAVFVSLGAVVLSADQITLQNGDILNGKVLTVTTNTLVLQDDSLGTLTLPRSKVSIISFGAAPAGVRRRAPPLTNRV